MGEMSGLKCPACQTGQAGDWEAGETNRRLGRAGRLADVWRDPPAVVVGSTAQQ